MNLLTYSSLKGRFFHKAKEYTFLKKEIKIKCPAKYENKNNITEIVHLNATFSVTRWSEK
jgi:hypothetical protein